MPVGEIDVRFGRLEPMRCYASAPLDDIARGLVRGYAGKAQRAPGVRASPDLDAVGVAGDEPHAIGRHPEPFAEQLRKACLMALAARQSADDHLDNAFRVHRNLGAFLRRAALRLDIGADPDAAPPAAHLGLGAARREPVPIGQHQCPVQNRMVLAAVIGHAERVGIGQRGGRDQVLPPQRDPVEAIRASRTIDQPLDDEHDLGPPSAAVRTSRRRVAQHRPRLHPRRRDSVEARHQFGTLGQWHEGCGISAEIAEIGGPQCNEVALRIERELGLDIEIAGLVVAEKRLLPLAGPFDWTAEPARRPGDEGEFRVGGVPRAEIAADIAGDDPHLVLWQTEHRRYILPGPSDAAASGVERDPAARRIELRERGARLHRHAGDALHPGREPGDVDGRRETSFGALMIADAGVEQEVWSALVEQ